MTAGKKKTIYTAALGILLIAVGVMLYFCLKPGTGSKDRNLIQVEGREIPAEMQQYIENENLEWMAGMWVGLQNCVPMADRDDVYENSTEPLRAVVTMQNAVDKLQTFTLMVLADGLPAEFQVGGQTYESYTLGLTGAIQVELTLKPQFSLHMGRLDFLLIYNENPQADFFMTNYTLWIQQEEPQAQPVTFQETVDQRQGLKGSYTGGAYGAWIWNRTGIPSEDSNIGPRLLSVEAGGTVYFEAVASAPGTYRTVLMVGNSAIDFVDWISNGENMLQFPIQLPKDLRDGDSFYTITTRLAEEDGMPALINSSKMEIDMLDPTE